MTRWAILTGEYPPDAGGVSDYTRLVAAALARVGDDVCVYAPPPLGGDEVVDRGVTVHRLPGRFGPRTLVRLEQLLAERPRPDRVLVQYVPHAFGFKAMNVPFAAWVALRLARVAPVWVMFHEVAFPTRTWPPRHVLLGLMTRAMARLVARAADRVFVSVPAWGTVLRRLRPRTAPPEWLPVPCNVATEASSEEVTAVRARYEHASGFLVGHFGTFGGLIADLLAPAVEELLRSVPGAEVLLVGRGSDSFRERVAAAHPRHASRVHAAGELAPEAVAAHLRACDLVIQPFPDGISSRRTSVMAALANGVAVVTNLGDLSEPLWAAGAVAAAPAPEPKSIARLAAGLLADRRACEELGQRGLALYRREFALERLVDRLRAPSR